MNPRAFEDIAQDILSIIIIYVVGFVIWQRIRGLSWGEAFTELKNQIIPQNG